MKKLKNVFLGIICMVIAVGILNFTGVTSYAANTGGTSGGSTSRNTYHYTFNAAGGSNGKITISVNKVNSSGTVVSTEVVYASTSVTTGKSGDVNSTVRGTVALSFSGNDSAAVQWVKTNYGTTASYSVRLKKGSNAASLYYCGKSFGTVYCTGIDKPVSTVYEYSSSKWIKASCDTIYLEGSSVDAGDIVTDYWGYYRTKTTYLSGAVERGSWIEYVIQSNVSESVDWGYSTSPKSQTEIGYNNVTVRYNGYSTTIAIGWKPKDLSSLTFLEYTGGKVVEGMDIPKGKVKLRANYNNGTSDIIYGDHYENSPIEKVTYNPDIVLKPRVDNLITVYYEYQGYTTQKASATFTIFGLYKDLVKIETTYEGDTVVEEMHVPLDKVKIVASYNNNTTETFYMDNPIWGGGRNMTKDGIFAYNSSGDELYNSLINKNDFLTTRWSVNNGKMTFTITETYTGETTNTKSDTIDVNVIKKTPVSIKADYPESKTVVEGLPFNKADLILTVTYNNGTEYKIDAAGKEYSGYTNGYDLHIYGSNQYHWEVDNPDIPPVYGDLDDLIVYSQGENVFIVEFTEYDGMNEGDKNTMVSTTFTVIGIAKKAIKIEAKYIGPDITMGLEFIPGDVLIDVWYDNDTVGLVKGDSNSVTITNKDGVKTCVVPDLGPNKYTVKFQDCTDTIEVIGKEAILTSIYVLKQPNQLFYQEDDAFDPTGMIVMATYSDFTESVVPNDALDIIDGDSLKVDQTTVAIQYTVGGITKSTEVEIYVDIGYLAALKITQEPIKLTYNPGEDFSPAGMVVVAVYSSGKERLVSSDEYTLANDRNLQSNQHTVTISLEERGVVASIDQPITVRPKELSYIEVLRQPSKTKYFPGEDFNRAGMAVTAVYTDGSTRVVTDECVVLDGSKLALGKKSVTISYSEVSGSREITKTAEIPIVVADASVDNIGAVYMGSEVKNGEEFNPADVMVTINYTDGTSKTVDGLYDGITFSSLVVKSVNNSVTVSYRGHTAVIKIPVLNDENNESQTITEIVSKGTWKEFFTVRKTKAVEDYFVSGGYKIPYYRRGRDTDAPLTMDIQFKIYAIEMGGWTTWYHSGEMVSGGNAPITNMRVGLLNANGVTLSGVINGTTYNDITSSMEFQNPQSVKFSLNGAKDVKLQYKVYFGDSASTGWVNEGTAIGNSSYPIKGISFRIVKK